MVVALQIRGVPKGVRDSLAERARARGQSLQEYLLALVESDARRSQNAAVLARFEGRTDGVRSEAEDVVADLAAAREERTATLDELL